jgi:hypothetical protein
MTRFSILFSICFRAKVAQSVQRLGYGMDDYRVRFPGGAVIRFLLFATASRLALGPTQPTVWGSYQGVNLTSHFHLLPGLRKRGAILPLPQYVFMTWCLIKQEMPLHDVVLSISEREIYLYIYFLLHHNELD